MKRIAIVVAAFLGVAPFVSARNSFGIIVDEITLKKCGQQLESYRKSIVDDGLDAYIIAAEWETPEQVKDSIKHYYDSKRLEGVVFVGDVPVAMIQGAQHMTSAFKMDENLWPKFSASVPSDRFYDDFDLKFNFEGSDSVKTGFFYYRLAPESPQEIHCDIYSARMKPSSDWGDKYAELSAYLEKLVRIKKEKNKLDKFFSYTGDGSFSNSLIAWKDETVTIGEQMPDTKKSADGVRFYAFAMTDYPKDVILKEIARDDLDFAFFHEHGVPERQYLSGTVPASDIDEYKAMIDLRIRERIDRAKRRGKGMENIKEDIAAFGLDSSWFVNNLNCSDSVRVADSLLDAHTGIMLPDIQSVKPNVRMVSFDACYNGDFRESDCIAARYIYAGGKCVVAIGNTVNVLQDKSSSDLLGMMACGYRAGEWMKETNILESHIHGDPTFHFESSFAFANPDLKNTDIKYWKKYLNDKYPCDIQGLALHKLFNLNCSGLSKILLDTFRSSKYYMLRLQCMHLAAYYNDGTYPELLKLAADDPYEFIRRKACFYMGKVGTEEMAEALAKVYLKEYNSLRVAFNITMQSGHFPDSLFIKVLNREIDKADWLYDKEAFRKEVMDRCSGPVGIIEYSLDGIYNKKRRVEGRFGIINGMRNNPYTFLAKDLLKLMNDKEEAELLRIEAAEVLGWYSRAWNRTDIIAELEKARAVAELPEKVDAEALKTINRLKEYTR